MDLREFVSETLTQIIAGVKDAQATAQSAGGAINARLTGNAEHAARHGFLPASGAPTQIVQFDVALTVKDGSGTKGGIGIFSGAINLGSSGESVTENAFVSRVKFSVPLTLPE